jgi:hypothetical protein
VSTIVPCRRSFRVQLFAILREYQLVSQRCFKVSVDPIESTGRAIAGRSSDDAFVYHGCITIETVQEETAGSESVSQRRAPPNRVGETGCTNGGRADLQATPPDAAGRQIARSCASSGAEAGGVKTWTRAARKETIDNTVMFL